LDKNGIAPGIDAHLESAGNFVEVAVVFTEQLTGQTDFGKGQFDAVRLGVGVDVSGSIRLHSIYPL
jgi:hypothetical protein